MKFKPSLEVEEFIENIHSRVGARNKAVLGRAGLFLALGEGIPPDFNPKDSQGKDLDDETVVGDELRDLVKAALNYRFGNMLSEASYRREFRRYFDYGCKRLKEIWEECENDQTRFVSELLKVANIDLDDSRKQFSSKAISIVKEAVYLDILENNDSWFINEAGHNGLMIISGAPGRGKSQLALDLLAQASKYGLRFIFFDLKGELENDPSNYRQRENRKKFFNLTNAQYIRLINQRLPINPLIQGYNPTLNAQIAYEIASLIRAYAPQLGANQERAIASAYQNLDKPDFANLANQLEQEGATGVDLSILKKIVDFNIFANSLSSISPEEWLKRSLVIDFKEFGNDNTTKSLVVAFILNFLMKRLNQNISVENGIQPLKMILFVDEAHLLLPKEGKAGLLGALARQGRSWGFPIWLASQDADAFITTGQNATNFAELADCGIHFSPETLNKSEQRQILGKIIPSNPLKSGNAIIRIHGELKTGITSQFWKSD